MADRKAKMAELIAKVPPHAYRPPLTTPHAGVYGTWGTRRLDVLDGSGIRRLQSAVNMAAVPQSPLWRSYFPCPLSAQLDVHGVYGGAV